VNRSQRSKSHRFAFACAMLSLVTTDAFAQACRPMSERTGELGCWITATASLGKLPAEPIFWHLHQFVTRAEAQAAKGPRGIVVEAFDKTWLLTIDIADWRPAAGGVRVAQIGPLPVRPRIDYSAQFMEGVFSPGMTAPVHRHSGPEAWYTLTGETCLETPKGKQIGRAGGTPVIVPEGPPMHLTATGKEIRRALVLVLHDTRKPATTPASDWQPKGLCKE
jgi:quercetin dioxygenase-like cupin family protein